MESYFNISTWADATLRRLQAGSTGRWTWETPTRDLNSLLWAFLGGLYFVFHKPAVHAGGYRSSAALKKGTALWGSPAGSPYIWNIQSATVSARLTKTSSHLTCKVHKRKWSHCFLTLQCLWILPLLSTSVFSPFPKWKNKRNKVRSKWHQLFAA